MKTLFEKRNELEFFISMGKSKKQLSLDEIHTQQQRLAVQEELWLRKALTSDNVDTLLKAKSYISERHQQLQQNRNTVTGADFKTLLVDPNDLHTSLGFKDKAFSVSYDILRGMARTHVIKAIIETRKSHISQYCQPQADKYSTGFVIQPRKKFSQLDNSEPLTREQREKIDELTEFLVQGGNLDNYWSAEPLDVFVGKLADDSLTLDQACAEIVRNRGGQICQFKAIDAATIRRADVDMADFQQMHTPVKGHYPTLVQVIDQQVVNNYYPWEMMFGVRNPSTSLHSNGYGRSELEDMVQTVTALLNADYYNSNFFKVGSAPKGILKYSGEINMNTVEQFKSQWVANTAGVMNMHKIPLINADKLDFVNLQQSNKDMEFSKFQEFLIKIACALYKIDPAEIGFPMAGSSQQPSFGGSVGNAEKLAYSKDKGLKPLLRYIERWINKYLIYPQAPDFEFRFVGMDDATMEQELDLAIKESGNFKTLNEIRKQRGLTPIEGGNIVLNPIYYQQLLMQQQQEQAAQQEGGEEDPYDMYANDGNQEGAEAMGELANEDQQHTLDQPENEGLVAELASILSQEQENPQ